jgi:hypothetical protein
MKWLKNSLQIVFFAGVLVVHTLTFADQQCKKAAGLHTYDNLPAVLVSSVEQSVGKITLRYQFPDPQFFPVEHQSIRGKSAQRCLMGNCDVYSNFKM